jgi:hypothetical protein
MHFSNFKDTLAVVEGRLIHVVEAKVKAATTAATATSLVVSVLGLSVFHGVVPDWVTAVVGTAATGGLTFTAGFLARHTPRTVAPSTPVEPPAPSTPPVEPPPVAS